MDPDECHGRYCEQTMNVVVDTFELYFQYLIKLEEKQNDDEQDRDEEILTDFIDC